MNQGRVALITGSAQGIGRAIALRLADEGYDIALNDLDAFKQELEDLTNIIKSKGRKVYAHVADGSMKEDVESLIDATVQNLGGLDVVSNSPITHTVIYADSMHVDGCKCWNLPY